MTTVYTGGTFDLFHAGHVDLLLRCHQLTGGDGRVVVGLNPDEFVAEFKGQPPVCTYQEREVVLRACRYVDDVVCNRGGTDSRPAIMDVAPDIIAIGSDWAKRDYFDQMGFTVEWLDAHEISLIYLPRYRACSSTMLKHRARGQR
jgi:cytidyltransferase-like protein